MGEHRKPCYIFLLKNPSKGKTNKIELFERSLFTNEPLPSRCKRTQYRIRVNGKWFPKDSKQASFYASWEIRDILWRSLPI